MRSSVRISMLFVFLWSTGFIAYKFCSAYAEPATLVMVRTTITAAFLALIVLMMRVDWPRHRIDFVQCSVIGILIHGVFAGGLYTSIYHGIDVKLCALILSLQPLLTVLLSSTFLGEKITRRKVFGILLGLLGVSMVIMEGGGETAQSVLKIGSEPSTSNDFFAISMCCVALLAISSATIIQKRYCGDINPMSGNCIQYAAAAIFMLPIALKFETMQINWSVNFILGLSWLIVFVSLGAMTLLMILIKQGEVGAVSSLLYLATPLVAIQAWLFFGDNITLTSLVGMLLCMIGVVIVNFASTLKPGLRSVGQLETR